MTLMRLRDGRVVVHSAIPLDDASMREIEAWGPIAFIVAPNALHDLDVDPYARRYPDAKVLCSVKSRKKFEKIARVDGTFEDLPGGQGIGVAILDGTKTDEPVFLVDSDGRTSLVFTDAIFNTAHSGGFKGTLFRWIGSTGGPRVTALFRLTAVKDRKALHAHLARLLATPTLARVIMSHGAIVESDLHGFTRTVLASIP